MGTDEVFYSVRLSPTLDRGKVYRPLTVLFGSSLSVVKVYSVVVTCFSCALGLIYRFTYSRCGLTGADSSFIAKLLDVICLTGSTILSSEHTFLYTSLSLFYVL